MMLVSEQKNKKPENTLFLLWRESVLPFADQVHVSTEGAEVSPGPAHPELVVFLGSPL